MEETPWKYWKFCTEGFNFSEEKSMYEPQLYFNNEFTVKLFELSNTLQESFYGDGFTFYLKILLFIYQCNILLA